MVTWLAGNRIRGTSSERLSTSGIGNNVGGWVELGRTTLGSANTDIAVSGLSNKRYLMILQNSLGRSAVSTNSYVRLNSDTGTNYAHRWSTSGGADSTQISQTGMFAMMHGGNFHTFNVGYISNYSSKEKLYINHNVQGNTVGAGNAPIRNEIVTKWANTVNAVSAVTATTTNAETFNIGSEVVVLGWDPTDTHTDNFWQELASSVNPTSVSFTSKKYIWIQASILRTGGTASCGFRLGNTTLDTGANYAQRRSTNGATDITDTSADGITSGASAVNGISFHNIFIVNNTNNEKLMISDIVDEATAGAGTAPNRMENYGKWVNTTNQANICGFYKTSGTGSIDTANSLVKIWGAN